jgi:hypothetical protein
VRGDVEALICQKDRDVRASVIAVRATLPSRKGRGVKKYAPRRAPATHREDEVDMVQARRRELESTSVGAAGGNEEG